MTLTIREIEQKDNPNIARVIRHILKEHGVDKPGTVFTDPTTDTLFEVFEHSNAYYEIVEDENSNEILGGCGIFPTDGLPDGCIELVKLYLHASTRGKGLGRTLMERSIEKAREMGFSTVYLETFPELGSAVELYRKLGFVDLNEPLGNSGHFACNMWMLKDLKGSK